MSKLTMHPAGRLRTPVGEAVDVLPATPPQIMDALPVADVVDVVPALPELPERAAAPPPLPAMPRSEAARPTAWWWRIVLGIASAGEWLFGVLTLIVGLAFLAAVPVLNLLSLGYLLEAGGRIARTRRFSMGFPGVRKAARIGSIVLGVWVMLLPLRLLSSLATSAHLIDPDGVVARRWTLGLAILTAVMVIHVVAAVSRGGKLRYFVWPFNVFWLLRRIWRGGYYSEARDATWNFVLSLRLPYYFWLGARGFAGAFLWLVAPVTLLAIGRNFAPIGFVGAGLLAVVLLYVPFMQMRFAAENRFRAFFEVRAIRMLFVRAPYAYLVAMFITLLFAVPLYLLKIEMLPREAAWLPSLFFIVSIFPARLLAGWTVARAEKRDRPRHWFFRWTARVPLLPMTLMYVLILFFTQYTAWNGVLSFYEQHAFLLPVPFMGM
jgi:hypothetical protein